MKYSMNDLIFHCTQEQWNVQKLSGLLITRYFVWHRINNFVLFLKVSYILINF